MNALDLCYLEFIAGYSLLKKLEKEGRSCSGYSSRFEKPRAMNNDTEPSSKCRTFHSRLILYSCFHDLDYVGCNRSIFHAEDQQHFGYII